MLKKTWGPPEVAEEIREPMAMVWPLAMAKISAGSTSLERALDWAVDELQKARMIEKRTAFGEQNVKTDDGVVRQYWEVWRIREIDGEDYVIRDEVRTS